MRSISLRSPSKINLHLRVSAPDASGFHPLRSWFVTTTLADTIECHIQEGDSGGVTLTCDEPSIPTDESNLICKAAYGYLNAARIKRSIAFTLRKRVPAGAGLGGGSSNAAAALIALDTLLGPLLSQRPAIKELAKGLGSDVPFFLGTTSAIATGRGEQLLPAPVPKARHALLILPPFGIGTPQAYRGLDQLRPVAPADTLEPFDVAAWTALPAASLSRKLQNDLELPAFEIVPSLGDLRSRLETSLDQPVRMSGSGSTLFALFDDAPAAAEARNALLQIATDCRVEMVELGRATIEQP